MGINFLHWMVEIISFGFLMAFLVTILYERRQRLWYRSHREDQCFYCNPCGLVFVAGLKGHALCPTCLHEAQPLKV